MVLNFSFSKKKTSNLIPLFFFLDKKQPYPLTTKKCAFPLNQHFSFYNTYLFFTHTRTCDRARTHTHIIFSFTFISLIPSTHDRKFSLFYPPDIVFPQTFLSLRPNIAKFDNYVNRLGKIKKRKEKKDYR